MSNPDQHTEKLIEKLRSVLNELTESTNIQDSKFRFVALIGTQEPDPEDPGESYISSEIFSAAGTEDLGEMLGTLVQAAIEEEEDNPAGQQYLVESVLDPIRSFLGYDEEE
ncbi:MAG: hypothetical protein KA479_05165 [Saprospiraceae bacterium]|jgi:hypothetical protein|nr:hypothetical protein [Saprospiraceae bacterium]